MKTERKTDFIKEPSKNAWNIFYRLSRYYEKRKSTILP